MFAIRPNNNDQVEDIEVEIELMKKLSHPNIVKYIDTMRSPV